jgi:hypothetical protein
MDFHGPIEYGKSGGEATEKRESIAVVDDYALGILTPFNHSLDLVLRKPKPLSFARMHAAPKLYIVDLVDVAFIVGLKIGRFRQLLDFFEDALFFLRVALALGL